MSTYNATMSWKRHGEKNSRIKGELVWHYHENTDEVFIVLKGNLTIHFRDSSVDLSEGDLFVVPRGVDHKPVANKECHLLLIEKKGTINTGNVRNIITRFREEEKND